MEFFVYGTLTAEAKVAALLDDYAFQGEAVLEGMHRVEGEYPTLAPGGEAAGRILETDEVATLDEYEAVDRGLYVRVSVPCEDAWEWVDAGDPGGSGAGSGDAATTAGPMVDTYVGAPAALGVDEAVLWPGEGSFEERVQAVAADSVVRRRD